MKGRGTKGYRNPMHDEGLRNKEIEVFPRPSTITISDVVMEEAPVVSLSSGSMANSNTTFSDQYPTWICHSSFHSSDKSSENLRYHDHNIDQTTPSAIDKVSAWLDTNVRSA
ncbi:hypothetical protein PRIPAC_96725 [Pristionchus pacificus]|uniref:Uncharacterized protein n=1 Tax=Pristionchus pacificus TaxID=54126 RepID=A0A2A6D2W9_PRIPA|nr:hypothetical protein PRIPAC_96725 [Pristionchus pacificus]|eukprot:PDM84822.1 hypothetical protein PRIPAC_33845 [Pristionchus pacificus]